MALTQSLDHLILFLPADPSNSLPSLPHILTSNFTLTPGGFHADGITSNTLIVLSDGCYVELISFVDRTRASTHWWGPDAQFVGWKDWCLTNSKSPEEIWEELGGKDGTHAEPVRGGRKRADGVDVQWAVTFPKGERNGQGVRGRIPFFCHDVTERNVRVPISAEKTTHPCGALGVRQLTVIVKDRSLLEETRRAYTTIQGQDGRETGDEEVRFQVARVHNVEGLDGGATIVLRTPNNEDEVKRTEKMGFWYGDVVLGVKAREGKELGMRERLDGGEDDVGGIWLEYV